MPPFPVPGTPAECVHRQRYRSTRHRRRDRRTSRLRALDGPVGSPRPSGPGHDRSDQMLPGALVWRTVRPRDRWLLEDITAGFGIGVALAVPVQIVAGLTHQRWLATALPLLLTRSCEPRKRFGRGPAQTRDARAHRPPHQPARPRADSSSRRAGRHTCAEPRADLGASGQPYVTTSSHRTRPGSSSTRWTGCGPMHRWRARPATGHQSSSRSSRPNAPSQWGRSSRSCAASPGADQPSCWARARRAPSRRATSASPRACGPSSTTA